MTIPTIAAYIRVSSRAQDHGMQRHAIEQAAGRRGDTVGRWYAEKRSSKTMDRAELVRLRADVRAGRIARLYVYRLDRLARTGIRDTFDVLDELRRSGCEVVTVADGFALDGPAAEIVIAVMAWAAKMERQAINERIATARERVEAEGGAWGRPWSYDADKAEEVRAMKADGKTQREIVEATGLSKGAVSRLLAPRKVATVSAPISDGDAAYV
jgi:DNA invertase Pin-like site-specific DNA recombinase